MHAMTRFLSAAALSLLLAAPAFAQSAAPATTKQTTPAATTTAPATAPATSAKPAAAAPATTAPAAAATSAKPAAPAAAQTQSQKVNLNTATAKDLDALPQIGEARAKAIVEARAKGKFKDWNDFVARKVVPSNAEAAIKDKVSF